MKKFAAILTAFLLAVGLTALVSPADASPYPGTVHTYCHLDFAHNVVRYHQRNRVRFSVSTAGTGRPKGVVRVIASNHRRTYARSYTYLGGNHTHAFRAMKRGRYSVHMVFRPRRGSVYRGCSDWAHRIHVR